LVRRFAWLLAWILLLASPGVALAESHDLEEEAGLARVTFRTEYVDSKGANVLREGMAIAWELMAPYLKDHGFDSFPTAHVWGFYDIDDARRVTGFSRSKLTEFQGWASGNRAYIFMFRGPPQGTPRTVVHEAVHLAQNALRPLVNDSVCLTEGAADWFALKASTLSRPDPARALESRFENGSDRRYPGMKFLDLTTSGQFQRAIREGGTAKSPYGFCLLAFYVLMKTGGGEEAYFDYLDEAGRVGWRTSFNRAFEEDLSVFVERFELYHASRFTDYRFPAEVRWDALLDKHLYGCFVAPGRWFCFG
jgi:hypothetical protein